MTESTPFNMCDGVRYSDPLEVITTVESILLDGSNGRMKVDFSGIWRGTFMTETMISVDSGCKVRNAVIRWQVSPEEELTRPTFPPPILFLSLHRCPCDCEGPSVDRESEFTLPTAAVANDPWVEYHVGMWKLHLNTVAIVASWNGDDTHGYGHEVRNVLRWHVKPQVETNKPTFHFTYYINLRDCEDPSVDRESVFRQAQAAPVPWVEYHVVMFEYQIYTVAIADWNEYNNHSYRCGGWRRESSSYRWQASRQRC